MKKSTWVITKTQGIDQRNISLDFLLLLDEKNKILLGTTYTDHDIINRRFDNYAASIFLSSDNGKHWRKTILDRGKFTAFAFSDSLVYLAVGSNISNETANFNDNASLYLSSNKGVDWNKVAGFSNFYIRDIFLKNNDLYLIGTNKNDDFWTLKKSADKGATWQDVSKLSLGDITPVVLDNSLWMLNATSQQLTEISLEGGSVKHISLSIEGFRPYFLSQANNGVIVAGVLNDKTVVFKYSNGKFLKVLQVDETGKYPVHLAINENNATLLLGKRDNIGTTYFIYSKRMDSENWYLEELPVYYFKPYSFSNNQIWGYNNGLLYSKDL